MSLGTWVLLAVASIFWIMLLIKHPGILFFSGLFALFLQVGHPITSLIVWSLIFSVLLTRTGHKCLIAFGLGFFVETVLRKWFSS